MSGTCEAWHERLDEWEVSERLADRPSSVEGKPFRDYQVVLQRQPKLGEDVGSLYIHGCYLAKAVDRAWGYATGRLLGSRGYDLFLSPLGPPNEWASNGPAAVPDGDWRILQSRLSTEVRTLQVATLPLRRALTILKGIVSSTDVLQQLAGYHYGALVTTDEELHFLLFAQAIDIVREMLRGRSAQDKEGQLPRAVREQLHHPLNHLFELCQQRRQTRHAIDKQQDLRLKPDLTHEEADAFQHDANLLISFVVTRELGVPLATVRDGVAADMA